MSQLLDALRAVLAWTATLDETTRLGLFTLVVFSGIWAFRKAFPEWWEGFASRPFGVKVSAAHDAAYALLRKVWQQFPSLLSGAALGYLATGKLDVAALSGAAASALHHVGKASPLRYRGATAEPQLFAFILNGRGKLWEKPSIAYEDLVLLAGHAAGTILTITHRSPNTIGSLVSGERLKIEPGLIVNVGKT